MFGMRGALSKSSVATSFVMRLWPTTQDGQSVWRVSLRGVESMNWQGFADLDSFFEFLRSETSREDFVEEVGLRSES